MPRNQFMDNEDPLANEGHSHSPNYACGEGCPAYTETNTEDLRGLFENDPVVERLASETGFTTTAQHLLDNRLKEEARRKGTSEEVNR